MLVRNPWPSALSRLALLLAAAAVVGLVSGHMALCLLIALAFYTGVQARNLVRMERWLRHARRLRPPQSQGLWGTIFDNLYRLQRRHRQRRQRLAELLRRFKESANAMPDATVVLRGHGEMLWWNTMATRYLGLRWPQDQGQRIANLFRHPQFNDFLAQGDWRDSVKVPSPVLEKTVLEVRIVPYGIDQQLLLARDVTRLHRLETMRRDFVANITHELRTPLTVIRGLAETLADDEQGPELERPLALIQQQTQRMGRLIDDLLLLSRLETGEQAMASNPVDVRALVEAVVDEGRAVSDGRHRLSCEVDESVPLQGDEGALRSAFSNLVVNAVKYTPTGGSIDVRWFRAEGVACLSVTDTGEGIPAHHIPRLTERFYRVDSGRTASRGGTGLGLAIVKHVMTRHGGELQIFSVLGEGSRFECRFPLERAAAPRVPVARGRS
ncbi:MAG TPA: phosphate regulon sensor histidine kinase PhoR [Gammaproteobacteria bacterium]|nr:phosphate regulon sensor histidine kinase PhoR [Gammaproteobacteria bacterium]